ncbi:MAG: helix-turn-helix transcriptional regulator [Oscillospiraceae bacterium]|nr:helix-turn-helix transcriptional regulator [Oscillospiraceae bacterium]
MQTKALTYLVISDVLSASSLFSPENKKGKRISRGCWAVVMKYEGETYYLSNGKKYFSDANHPVILPKGCSYEWNCTKAGRFYSIEFESDATFTDPIPFTVANSEQLLKRFKELEYKRNLKTSTIQLESIRDTYSIILTLLKPQSDSYLPAAKKEKLKPAIAYISQNHSKKITNGQLAGLCGLSTVYFRKLFTQAFGVSPIVYTQNLRIEKAKELLSSDYGTLSDLALSLGYTSLYDFSRAFKKHTGIAPSKYRKE